MDQATEIAKAEESLRVPLRRWWRWLGRSRSRCSKRRPAGEARGRTTSSDCDRQREARTVRTYSDELGMFHVHLRLEPHVGTPIVARAEAEATRLAKAPSKNGREEPSSATLPMPTPAPGRTARAGPSVPSSSCW